MNKIGHSLLPWGIPADIGHILLFTPSTAEGQYFICPPNIGYIPYYRVILAFRGIFLPEKRVLQDMICCPSAVNKCPFKRTYYSIFGKECLVFGYIICSPFKCNVCLLLLSLWALV